MGRITGITIDVMGNTSPLVNSLRSADAALKNTNTALKDVNKALQLPGAAQNFELLTSKSNLLAEAIDQNSERLDILKATAEEAMKTLGEEGGTTQAQMAQLQAEIATATETLTSLEGEAAETDAALAGIGDDAAGSLDDLAGAADDAAGAMGGVESGSADVNEALGSIAGKAEEVGQALKTHLTDPLEKIGKAALSAFDEVVNGGMDTIVRKTGATGADLEALGAIYENVFGSMPVTAEQAGAAIGEINTRFGYTGQQLEETAKAFLKFANVNGTDVSGAVASVDKIMLKFGVDSSQTGNVLDLLTKASQTSGISVDTLAGNLESSGAQLKEMGFDLTESVNLLAQFESSGVDANAALTAFKKEVMASTKAGTDAETELRSRIEAIKQATTDTEALQIATEVFGGKAAPEMTQAIREGRLSIDELSGSLSDYSGTVTSTFEATQDPTDDAKVAFNNLKLAGSELGSSILSTLSPAIDGLASAAKGLNEWFSSLDPTTQKVISTIGILAATLGPLLIVISSVITAVQTIMTVLPAVKGAIIAVNAALAANPIALVVIAIAGLVAAFVALWNNCEEFRQFWIDLWDSLQAGAQVVIDGIGTAFEQLGEGFSQVGDGIMLMFDSIGGAFSTLSDNFDVICTSIGGFFSTMGESISGTWDTIIEGIKGGVNTVIGFVNTMIAGAEGAINFLVDAINTLHWEIPDWVPLLGGKEFGFDVPHASFPRVPELAQGAVIPPNSPFLAVLGDQPSGTNIEAPLSTIKDALLQAMAQSGNTSAAGPHVFNVYIGNERFGTAVAQANSRNAYISGGY